MSAEPAARTEVETHNSRAPLLAVVRSLIREENAAVTRTGNCAS